MILTYKTVVLLGALTGGQAVAFNNAERDSITERLSSAKPRGSLILRDKWAVTCDSVAKGSDCHNAIDGNDDTSWQPEREGHLHHITVTLGGTYNVSGLGMSPGPNKKSSGSIGAHEIELSRDGTTWNHLVAYGVWVSDSSQKFATFEPQPADYVRLVIHPGPEGSRQGSITDLTIYSSDSGAHSYSELGKWGPTIDLPIVPTAAGINPLSGDVIMWSSNSRDLYAVPGAPSLTYTSIWNSKTHSVSQRIVSNTNHDMFCPGTSMDSSGRFIVSGGSTETRTSIFDPHAHGWVAGPDLVVPRGYQSSVTISDGRVFTIGGSWHGGDTKLKNGEIYNPVTNTWSNLTGAAVEPMLTHDSEDFDDKGARKGYYHSDNHAWLFGWKGNTIFQAGPSAQMNWYSVDGQGGVKGGGLRCNDRGGVRCDAMNGNAVMYDATAGRIIAFGGAPDYSESAATSDAFLISLQDADSPIHVIRAGAGLNHARAFHSSVVLPDGTVFLTGGQSYARHFEDTNAVLTPELYLPRSNSFIDLEQNSIPRNYHSWSLLLPDARILNGGGGLCGESCDTNHFDAQIYTPPYLLTRSGMPARRPRVINVTGPGDNELGIISVKPGDRIMFETDSRVTSASLIRYSTTTHTVNTDQRRIPPSMISSVDGKTHTFELPRGSGIAIPGYWMLFALDQDGVPSEAVTIQITDP